MGSLFRVLRMTNDLADALIKYDVPAEVIEITIDSGYYLKHWADLMGGLTSLLATTCMVTKGSQVALSWKSLCNISAGKTLLTRLLHLRNLRCEIVTRFNLSL